MKIILDFMRWHGFLGFLVVYGKRSFVQMLFYFPNDIVWPLFCTFAIGKTDCKSIPFFHISRDCTIKN